LIACPSCSASAPEGGRFCSSCGSSLESISQLETGLATPSRLRAVARPPSSSGVGRLASSDRIESGGFTPGSVLGQRYRIIGLLGRGGMGEVYRADDLKLGQPVALKFLPRGLSDDPTRLERFYAEVRIARQVSHPNVCRVYDVGEIDGQQYLSMEYVDGEDLASLLKRIGRLPNDKAVEIARQLCAGLAAAHDKGVLHRDLKPANVMIDGRGHARITDFGLAVAAGEVTEAELSGTPAYMAPEQLAGKGASVRSDIYGLGLVLYELFTGRRAFTASTLSELKRKKEEEAPPSLLESTRDVDPLVDRVILRCLDRDPRGRPASALQVAAALPGGDPLAAALAAGETPSPEMVAASGASGSLSPALAWSFLTAIVVCLIAATLLTRDAKIYRLAPLEKPPEVLVDRSREILQGIGAGAFADSAFGFQSSSDFLQYVVDHDRSPRRWDHVATGAVSFWYRQSPTILEPRGFLSTDAGGGVVSPSDPSADQAGMAVVWLNPQGRLTKLTVVPPRTDEPDGNPPPADWSRLFAAAGLDPSQWKPAPSRWIPPAYADARAAWTGTLPDRPETPMRIEAASYRGRPISFELIGPWIPNGANRTSGVGGRRVGQLILVLLFVVVLAGSAFLARRNLRMGRGDKRGAGRLAAFVFATHVVAWLFAAHHVVTVWEVGMFVEMLSWALFISGALWLLYVALEPQLRRLWPATIVSWSRVLSGALRDPLVGRDVLFGCLAGAAILVLSRIEVLLPSWLGQLPGKPDLFTTSLLRGLRLIVANLLVTVDTEIFVALALLFLLLAMRSLLRSQIAAFLACGAILTVADSLGSDRLLITLALVAATWLAVFFVLMRLGLVAVIVMLYVNGLGDSYPITPDSSAWYSGIGFAALAVMGALALYGLVTALGLRNTRAAASID